MSTKPSLTREQIKRAIANLRVRVDATRDLMKQLCNVDGKYYQITNDYNETMGIWPISDCETRYTSENFWQDRQTLSKLMRDALPTTINHYIIDNPDLEKEFETSIKMTEAIIEQLECELASM